MTKKEYSTLAQQISDYIKDNNLYQPYFRHFPEMTSEEIETILSDDRQCIDFRDRFAGLGSINDLECEVMDTVIPKIYELVGEQEVTDEVPESWEFDDMVEMLMKLEQAYSDNNKGAPIDEGSEKKAYERLFSVVSDKDKLASYAKNLMMAANDEPYPETYTGIMYALNGLVWSASLHGVYAEELI